MAWLLGALGLAACGADAASTPLPIPTPTPTAPPASLVQARAVEVMAGIDSFKASGRISQGGREVFVTADVKRPSDYALQATIIEVGAEQRVEAVAKDGVLFIKPHGFQGWYKVSGPGLIGFDLPNATELLENVLTEVERLTFQGRELVGGVDVYHFRGEVESASLDGLGVGDSSIPSKVVLDLWVGQADGRVHKLGVTGSDADGPYSAVFSLSSFNEAKVSAPASADSLEELRADFIKSTAKAAGLPPEALDDKLVGCMEQSLGLEFFTRLAVGDVGLSEEAEDGIEKCLKESGKSPKASLVDPSAALPQTPAELKALLERLPVETQTCLRLAVGDQVYVELRAGQRLPTLQELTAALPCLR